jgi:hypothetical protein
VERGYRKAQGVAKQIDVEALIPNADNNAGSQGDGKASDGTVAWKT